MSPTPEPNLPWEHAVELLPKVLAGSAAIYGIWRKGLKPMVEAIKRHHRIIANSENLMAAMQDLRDQLRTNGGTSLRDAVDRIERASNLNAARVSALTNFFDVGVFEADMNGGFIYANRKLCELTGYFPDQHLGAGWVMTVHPDDRDRVFEEWRSAAEFKREFMSTFRFQRLDGTSIVVECHSVPMKDHTGKIIGFCGHVQPKK